MQAMNEEKICETLLMVSLRVSHWTARRKDKAVTRETNERHNARNDAGAFTKRLMLEVKPLVECVGETRAGYYHYTLPWTDKGVRVCSVQNYGPLINFLYKQQEKFSGLVDSFVDRYPALVKAQAERLGSMFDINDYPSPGEIKGRFGLKWFVTPLPVTHDVRFKVSESERERLKNEIKKSFEEGLREAQGAVWTRLHEAVKHAHEKLSAPGAIYRDTLIGNIEKLIEVMPGLNITNDPELAKIGKEVQDALCNLDPVRMRKNRAARQRGAQAASDVLRKIETAMPAECAYQQAGESLSSEEREKLARVDVLSETFDF